MYPIIAKIGPLYVYSYGLMVAIGFAVATFFSYKNAPKFGIDKEKVIDLGIVMLVGGILGARIFYVIMNFQYYLNNPFEIINLTKGGLVWYGAFISGIFATAWFLNKNKINFWNAADLFAPYLALAQAFGRIGCFFNGCCYGKIVHDSCILGLTFPGESVSRYPTQIFSAIALFVIFIVLKIWQKRRHFLGEIFLGYGMLYSVKRFIVEFFRGDYAKILYGLTISQFISMTIFTICIAIFIYKYFKWKNSLNSV